MKFFKYCASGNDFVIFNAGKKANRSELARILCNRYEGVGADGMIVILPHEKYDFEWEFYNKDGSRAAMCGNGSRAAAHFAYYVNEVNSKMCFLSEAGVIEASVKKSGVEVVLGEARDVKEPFEFGERVWQYCDTGVPHLVHFCENIEEFDKKTCQVLRKKYNANVNFAQIIDDKLIKVRTFERGVEDETLACGTGMAACFYLAFLQKKLKDKVKIVPKSGEQLGFSLKDKKIYFKGKVKCCFEANYYFS